MIAILATGDEIIHGDTLNTNGHVIAQVLSSDGLSLGLHVTCGDREQEIVDCLDFLTQKHTIIIMIGGLGPTSDDRTRFALARFLNTPLIEFPVAMEHIQTRLSRANLVLNSGNQQQALFPHASVLFPNPMGTAMGCCYSVNNQLFFLLPGPPRECLPMFNEYAMPVLQQTQHSQKCLMKWRLFGVAESAIAERLELALADIKCETGYRLETPYVEFKVRCEPAEMVFVKHIVEPLVAEYIIAPPETRASDRLRLKLDQIQKKMIIIDDATGGILQSVLQSPSNYAWLKFHMTEDDAESRDDAIYFHLKGLQHYWSQQNVSQTEVSIEYRIGHHQGNETHTIPFFSASVVYYACEWLSFRLLHLIDQLHQ